MMGRLLQAMAHGPCKDRILVNGFSSVLGLKASIENIAPRTLDSILLCIFLGHEFVLEPLFSPIASNPLDSCLALMISLFRVCLVQFC